MYNISNDLKNILHQNTRIVKPRLTYVHYYWNGTIQVDETLAVIDNKYIEDWTVETSINSDGLWYWGDAPAASLTITLLKSDANFFTPQPWTSVQIKVEVGIYNTAGPYDGTEDVDDDENFTFIPIGIFRCDGSTIEETPLAVSFTAYDEMVNLDYEMMTDAGTQGTVETGSIYNTKFHLEQSLACDWSNIDNTLMNKNGLRIEYTKQTNKRQIAQWFAIWAGRYARINREGNFELYPAALSPVDTLTQNDYEEFMAKENLTERIAKFTGHQQFISDALHEDKEEGEWTTTITSSDTTSSKANFTLEAPCFYNEQSMLNSLNNGGINFCFANIPYSYSGKGMPHIDVGDTVWIQDHNGDYVKCCITNHTLSYVGGTLRSEFSSESYGGNDIVGTSNAGSVGGTINYIKNQNTNMFDKIYANSASISTLAVKKLDADMANLDMANISTAAIDYLASQIIDADQIRAITADLGYLTSTEISANYASINELHSSYATLGQLNSSYASIGLLNSSYANIGQLNSSYATINGVAASYAQIDLANITQGALSRLFVDTGILTDATISTASVVGMLNSVNVNADKITAGTLNVNRLNIYDDNGIVYAINAQNVSSAILGNLTTYEQTHQLHGNDIIAQSITANKIAANTITANEIAAKTITAGQIAGNTITGNEILANTITANKLDVQTLSAITANMGTVSAGIIQGDNAYLNLASGNIRLGSTATDHMEIGNNGATFANNNSTGTVPVFNDKFIIYDKQSERNIFEVGTTTYVRFYNDYRNGAYLYLGASTESYVRPNTVLIGMDNFYRPTEVSLTGFPYSNVIIGTQSTVVAGNDNYAFGSGNLISTQSVSLYGWYSQYILGSYNRVGGQDIRVLGSRNTGVMGSDVNILGEGNWFSPSLSSGRVMSHEVVVGSGNKMGHNTDDTFYTNGNNFEDIVIGFDNYCPGSEEYYYRGSILVGNGLVSPKHSSNDTTKMFGSISMGYYNTTFTNQLFALGNGEVATGGASTRSNALSIDKAGNATFSGVVNQSGISRTGNNVITMASGYTLASAEAVKVGRLVQLTISFVKNSSLAWPATGDIADMSFGTLKSDFYPRLVAMTCDGGMVNGCNGTIDTSGNCVARRLPAHGSASTISAKATTFLFRATYMSKTNWTA